MPVPALQLPGAIQAPQVNWSGLDKIGDAFHEQRQQQLIGDAVKAATGPDGKVDANMVSAALATAGLSKEAMPWAQIGQTGQFHKDSLAQQQAQLAQTGAHYKATEAQAAAALAETRREHDLQLGKPFLVGSDLSGEIYAARTPDGNYKRIDPKSFAVQPAMPQAAPTQPQPQPQPQPAPQQATPSPDFNQRFNGASPAGTSATAPTQNAPPVQQQPQADPSSIDPATGRREGFLKTIPPDAQDIVKKIASYEIDPRTLSIKGGHRERLLGAVSTYDPTYDQNTYPARGKAVRDFATGPQGNAVRSFDVAIDHLDLAKQLATALNNGDTRIINSIRNKWREEFGSEIPTNFDAVKHIVADEITKAVIGSKGALGDRESAVKPLNTAGSPAQLMGVIDTVYKPLMAGQLKGLKKQYEDTTGRKDFDGRVRESTRNLLLGPQSSAGGETGTTAAPVQKIGSYADLTQSLNNAQAAIRSGAPRDVVVKKLIDGGVPREMAEKLR